MPMRASCWPCFSRRTPVTTLGDRLTLLDSRRGDTAARRAKLFGKNFADALIEQPTGRWSGPIASGYGLVRVDSATRTALPTLEQVRPVVEREWRNAKRRKLATRFTSAYQAIPNRHR